MYDKHLILPVSKSACGPNDQLSSPLPSTQKARGRPEITTARIRCECQRRAPAAASTAAEGPEPEPERQPQGYSLPVLLLWARLVRRARRLKRLRRIWATIGNYLREVKERGREE